MRCPTCGKTAEWQDNPARPFCSERCKLIDFGRWANEEYSVPAESPLSDEPEIEMPSAPSSADNTTSQR